MGDPIEGRHERRNSAIQTGGRRSLALPLAPANAAARENPVGLFTIFGGPVLAGYRCHDC
jgi:hypothetical protein